MGPGRHAPTEKTNQKKPREKDLESERRPGAPTIVHTASHSHGHVSTPTTREPRARRRDVHVLPPAKPRLAPALPLHHS